MTALVPPVPEAAPTLRVGRLGPGGILRIAGGGLASRRLRSVVTALGIAIGIAAMLAVLGIAESSRATLLAELDRRRTVLALGFSSLFSFCTDRLGLTKASAFRRTTASRLPDSRFTSVDFPTFG